ncbi:MAG TPA: MoaD/ThiS family protein [Gemmatimonadaceae bacterium]|nr:MoaD/ThiS family protein [Gemmatimonadaceae bacterium]
MIVVELPRALQPYAAASTVVVLNEPCATVGDALAALGSRCPGVLDRIVDERGDVRAHVNVFVGDESIRFLDGLATPLSGNSAVTIVAAVSGG